MNLNFTNALNSTKKFVADHKVGIAVTTTAIVATTATAAVFIKAKNLTISQIDGFLKFLIISISKHHWQPKSNRLQNIMQPGAKSTANVSDGPVAIE